MRWLLNCVYLSAIIVTLPYWLFKAATAGKYRKGLWRKLSGRGADAVAIGDRRVVWFHAVSVGEVLLLKPLLTRMSVERPDLQLVVSTTTETGYAVATEIFPHLAVFYAPMDFTWAVRRTFDRLRPSLLVLAELELWPNLLLDAGRRNVPVAVINARMGLRSYRGYSRIQSWIRPALDAIVWWGVQTEAYAERIRSLTSIGSESENGHRSSPPPRERITVTGSMKYDGAPTDRTNARTAELRRFLGLQSGECVWVAGSTQGPEDAIVLDAFQQLSARRSELRLILVPRHRERFDEAADLIAARKIDFVRRSRIRGALPSSKPVTLVDTIGELSAVWGLADFGFVGGSLDGVRGGQSMIEPAGYGVPICFGPHTWNFQDTVDKLLSINAAVRLKGPEELASTLAGWLEDREAARRLGERARNFIRSQQGAVAATAAALNSLVPIDGFVRRSA